MELLIVSFLAGFLTVLTPCVLPILPIVLGGSVSDSDKKKPFIIIASLSFSVLLFSLLLKFSTLLINVDPDFWKYMSGGIIVVFGFFTLYPEVWEKISEKIGLGSSTGLLQKSSQKGGNLGNVLVGMSLGPVFSSCSPTYAVILAVVLPQSFGIGFLNLVVYTIGLAVALLLIAIFGQKATTRLKWAADPSGWFRKALGIIFVLVGIAIITGYDKKIEIALLDNGLFDFTKIDQRLIDSIEVDNMINNNSGVMDSSLVGLDLAQEQQGQESILNVNSPYEAPEIVGINSWINSEGENLKNLEGKVVVVDFWTYSCINCIRTLPYLKEWHSKYADDGLVILGIHAPEFAFEKDRENLLREVQNFGIEYPVGQDNDFLTWRAYNNRYWPAKYFIDKQGKVRHTHFGEGAYAESEEVIRLLLMEGGSDVANEIPIEDAIPPTRRAQSPETYLGYGRGENLIINTQFEADKVSDYGAVNSSALLSNQWTLGGQWEVTYEHSLSHSDDAILSYNFSAKNVYLVMGAEQSKKVKVVVRDQRSGEFIPIEDYAGKDVDENGNVLVSDFRLYELVNLDYFSRHMLLELQFESGVQINAFTFGS